MRHLEAASIHRKTFTTNIEHSSFESISYCRREEKPYKLTLLVGSFFMLTNGRAFSNSDLLRLELTVCAKFQPVSTGLDHALWLDPDTGRRIKGGCCIPSTSRPFRQYKCVIKT